MRINDQTLSRNIKHEMSNQEGKIRLLGKFHEILPKVNSQRNHEISSKKDMRAFNEKTRKSQGSQKTVQRPPKGEGRERVKIRLRFYSFELAWQGFFFRDSIAGGLKFVSGESLVS